MANTGTKLTEEWRRRINWAKAKHKAVIEPVIDKNLSYYRGNHYPNLKSAHLDYDLLTNNKIFSNVKTIAASINIRDPRAFVHARRKPTPELDTQRSAQLLDISLNYFIKELAFRAEVSRVLHDALLMPWGIMKLGFMPNIEKFSKTGDLLEMHELMKPSWPYWVRWSPRHFLMDPEVDRIEEARWVAFFRLEHIEDLKANPALTTLRDLEATVHIKSLFDNSDALRGVPASGSSDPNFFKRVGVWEIWDRKKQQLIEISDGSTRPLRDEAWPYQLDGFPCSMLYFNINPDEQVPIADVTTYIDQQDELNRIESLMLEHIKRHLPVMVSSTTAFEDEDFENLKRGEIGKIVKVGGTSLRDALGVVQGAQLSPDVHIIRRMLEDNLDETSGVSQLERGSAIKVDTATEASILQASSNLRREDRRIALQTFMTTALRIFRQILQQTMTDPLQLQVDNNVLQKVLGGDFPQLQGWLTIDKGDIQGEFTEEVEVGSAELFNQAMRKQDAREDLQLLRGAVEIDQRELLRDYLEAKGKRDYDRLLLSPQKVQQVIQSMRQQEQEQAGGGTPGAGGLMGALGGGG